MIDFDSAAWAFGAARGRRCGAVRIDHAVDQSDDLVGGLRRPQRCHEVRPHQSARQAGQQLHVLGAGAVRCGDQEHQIGRAVGCAEVDLRRQAGEPDRRGRHRSRPAVRNGDAAGQSGGRLRLPGERRGFEVLAVGHPSALGEPAGEPVDDRLLVGACVDVEEHQIGADDGHGVRHGVLAFWCQGRVGERGGVGRNRGDRYVVEVDLCGRRQRRAGQCGGAAAVGDRHLQPLRRFGTADVGAHVTRE